MHPEAPFWLEALFVLTTLFSLILFYRASHSNKTVLLISILWLLLQGLVTQFGFYTDSKSMPPRFVLLVLPPLVLIISLFISPKGRRFLDSFDLKALHWLHVVRVPVEICLLLIFLSGLIPEVMTFEGRNFDILAGLTAPLMIWLYFSKKSVSNTLMIWWNIVSVLLLVNIVAHAIVSAPFAFQQISFDQPNVAVLYFPFSWLPAYIVPVVFLSHFASIRALLRKS